MEAIVLEDLDELQEATFKSDYFKMTLCRECIFNKPIKLRPIKDTRYYFVHHGKSNFSSLPWSYQRCEAFFDLAALKLELVNRFIELLAPLTLYHFRQSSKELYYKSLDLRGLEYSKITVRPPSTSTDSLGSLSFAGFSGMLNGKPLDGVWAHFQVCQNTVDFNYLTEYPTRLSFVKKYKTINVVSMPPHFVKNLSAFLEAVFHPGLENANILTIPDYVEVDVVYISKAYKQLLPYCKSLKNLRWYATQDSSANGILVQGDPGLIDFKEYVENWAQSALRMEICIFSISLFDFQLVDKKLKRCVFTDKKWFWTENYHIFDGKYPHYNCIDIVWALPWHLTQAPFADIIENKQYIKYLKKCNCRRIRSRPMPGRIRSRIDKIRFWINFYFEQLITNINFCLFVPH